MPPEEEAAELLRKVQAATGSFALHSILSTNYTAATTAITTTTTTTTATTGGGDDVLFALCFVLN